ncbi:MAG: methyltransferase domain-containing protein [Thermoguttaceae bacterium]|jgi:ubiquinone/menaquinone biosynthesis C-methylase UbiE|nr:methyltransferase domain-containing protein [Thermoguttaceae bacterium]
MNEQPSWQWNEMQQVGTDYADAAEVDRYERRMSEFRDLPAENAAILALLALPEGSHILEIGTGTGHFAREAARAGHRVTALDVSPVMLQYAEAKAKEESLTGIAWRHGGFLTLAAPPATFDAAVSVMALHHLPDLWKAAALHNIHRVLQPGGRFLLGDVVFSSAGRDPRFQFDAFLDSLPPAMREEAGEHVAKEFSTLDWIMEELLVRAGFAIERIADSRAPIIQYLCRTEP